MLYLIGIGLGDEKDITVKGLESIKKSKLVYLEGYTSRLQVKINKLESFYGKKIKLLKREDIENNEKIINEAKKKNVSVLVIGDVFAATTHIEFVMRAKKEVKVEIIHNASVLNLVSETGLSLYNFGKITSLPFENENINAPFNVWKENRDMHTLVLLDLNEEKIMGGKEAIEYFLKNGMSNEQLCVVCCGLGSKKQKIVAGKAKELLFDINIYPQCLIIPGKMHFIEEEFLREFILLQQ